MESLLWIVLVFLVVCCVGPMIFRMFRRGRGGMRVSDSDQMCEDRACTTETTT